MSIEWAAGLYEGEGTFYLNQGKPSLNIRMTNREALEKFQEAIPVGKIYGPYLLKKAKKPLWCFQPNRNSEVLTIIYKIYPYLTKVRQVQILDVLEEAEMDLWAEVLSDLSEPHPNSPVRLHSVSEGTPEWSNPRSEAIS